MKHNKIEAAYQAVLVVALMAMLYMLCRLIELYF